MTTPAEISLVTDHLPCICPLEWGLIGISGENAEHFLQGQVTCDVTTLQKQASILGAYCNPQGQIRCIFLLFKEKERYILRLTKELLPSILALLKKFGAFSKVHIEDLSETMSGLGFYASEPPSSSSLSVIEVRSDGPKRFEVYGPSSLLLPTSTLPSISFKTWELLEIRAGLPAITLATQEKIVAQYANLEQLGALCHTKGCYSGQEIIARIHHRNVIKQQLYQVTLESDLEVQPGDLLYPEGLVLQAFKVSPSHQELLIVLPTEAWASIEKVRVRTENGPTILAPLPA